MVPHAHCSLSGIPVTVSLWHIFCYFPPLLSCLHCKYIQWWAAVHTAQVSVLRKCNFVHYIANSVSSLARRYEHPPYPWLPGWNNLSSTPVMCKSYFSFFISHYKSSFSHLLLWTVQVCITTMPRVENISNGCCCTLKGLWGVRSSTESCEKDYSQVESIQSISCQSSQE